MRAGAIRVRTVAAAWWPLAASWLLMGLELPLVSAFMARLKDPTVSLAAYGGVVFPLALMIESPIIMLLSASTALSKDLDSYRLVRRFMFATSGVLTVFHALLAFTPLYYVLIGSVMAPPAEILEPARRGLQIMLPWTVSIAYRRFQQGAMIRFGRSHFVGIGTAVRVAANLVVLTAGLVMRHVPGIVVGTLAVVAGVVSEAVFVGIAVRPVLRGEMPLAHPVQPLTYPSFLRFYAPLALTTMILFFAMPLATAGMSRMPRAIESLAAWPVINGLVFALRSTGFAMNEVVIAMLERPLALPALRRFTGVVAAGTTLLLLLVAATPISHFWFAQVSALAPPLVTLASAALWFAVLMPALSALQSLYQGAIVHSHRTRAVTESVIVYLASVAIVLVVGVATHRWTGLFVGLTAGTLGSAAQVTWLAFRARRPLEAIADDDLQAAALAGEPA